MGARSLSSAVHVEIVALDTLLSQKHWNLRPTIIHTRDRLDRGGVVTEFCGSHVGVRVIMTRMWKIAPELLCDQHLLGEHNELHQIVGTIRKHPHSEAILEGHAREGQIETSAIQSRHDDLVEEMESRDMNHLSPMEYNDELDIGEVDPEVSLEVLYSRCEECRNRIIRKRG